MQPVQIQTDGAVKGQRVRFHPNGTEYHCYSEHNRLGGKKPWIRFVRYENGAEHLVREWLYGTPPFTDHGDISDFDFAPDGSVVFLFAFNVIDDDRSAKAQRFRVKVPQLVPPYTPAASYTYVCSATDTVAREQVQGAVTGIGQVRSEMKLVRTEMRAFNGELDGKAESAARRVGEEVLAKARSLVEGAINALLARLWGNPGDQPAGAIMDRVWEDLNNPDAPLPNIIAQQALAAVKRELTRLGLWKEPTK